MEEQIRGEDWLPEGWKVEIRVRKSGKKDRYYTDPVNGYIFRSLKDIDRYLLSGKLGKHVTKNKPKNLDCDNEKFDFVQHTDDNVPKKTKLVKSMEVNKLCVTAAQEQKRARNKPKRDKIGAENSKELVKKIISRSSKEGRSSRPKKKRESAPFFILDPDQCEDSSAPSIPNLSEIIDSMLKEKESSTTVYLSAPAIGSLIGEKLSETCTNYTSIKPKFSLNMCKDNGIITSNKLPFTPSELIVKNEDWESRVLTRPYHLGTSQPEKSIEMSESKADVEGLECSGFGELFDDPCIDFAIKTLTGNISLGV